MADFTLQVEIKLSTKIVLQQKKDTPIHRHRIPCTTAPSVKLFASNSELLLLLKLVDNTTTFLLITSFLSYKNSLKAKVNFMARELLFSLKCFT